MCRRAQVTLLNDLPSAFSLRTRTLAVGKSLHQLNGCVHASMGVQGGVWAFLAAVPLVRGRQARSALQPDQPAGVGLRHLASLCSRRDGA